MAAAQDVASALSAGRIGHAIAGLLAGLVLVVPAILLLAWSERAAVRRAQVRAANRPTVVEVSADRVDPAHDGKLVHLAGLATTPATLSDPLFAVRVPAIGLDRVAEMYQWQELIPRGRDGSDDPARQPVTSIAYVQGWSERFWDSRTFRNAAYQGRNPPVMPLNSQRWMAQDVTVGAFKLSPELVADMTWATPYRPPAGPVADAAAPATGPATGGAVVSSFTTPAAMTLRDGVFYSGDPSAPRIGDVRVRFATVQPQVVSVVATQVGNSLEDRAIAGRSARHLVVRGEQSPDQTFGQIVSLADAILAVLVRLGMLLAMGSGLYLLASRLAGLADRVPLIGRLLAPGPARVAVLGALGLGLVTMAAAWMAERPGIGLVLLGLGLACLVWLALPRRARLGPAAAPA